MFFLVLFVVLVIKNTFAAPQCGSDPACCESASAILKVFQTEHDVNVFTAISYYESDWGRRKGPNSNTDGSVDVGLLQLNSYICCSSNGQQNDCCCPGTYPLCRHDATKRTCSCECRINCQDALINDVVNIECAKHHKEHGGCGGYKCWAAYNSHTAECEAYLVLGGDCAHGSCCSTLFPGATCCSDHTQPDTGCCPPNAPICCGDVIPGYCCPTGTTCIKDGCQRQLDRSDWGSDTSPVEAAVPLLDLNSLMNSNTSVRDEL